MSPISREDAQCLAPELELHVRHWGSGPPRIVLIHGLGDGGFVWHELVSHLSAVYSGICVDLRGHGDSPWDPLQRYHASVHVADVTHAMDALKLSEMVLMGHSLGAEVAIRVAAAKASAVKGLIIVDGGPDLETRAALALRQQMTQMSRHYESVSAFARSLEDRHPLADERVLQQYAHSALRASASPELVLKLDPAVCDSLQETPDTLAIWAALNAAHCPKLLVRGSASSFLSSRKALNVSQNTPNCQLVTVPRAGHSVPLDNPAGLHAAITPFLAEVLP